MNHARISVVIPNYNGAARLEICLRSLVRQSHPALEILIVDNASRDGSVDIVRRTAPDAKVLCQSRNLGFAAAVNVGIRAAEGDWIAILNNDTEADTQWLAAWAAAIERHPDAIFLACRILDFNHRDRIYSTGDCFLRLGVGYRRGQELPDGQAYAVEIPIFSACGCAALIRKSALVSAGGYDERFFAYLEDVDLGLRLKISGASGYYIPSAVVYHVGGATSGGEFAPLAVRLRTRNAILLLLKSLPASIALRCAPRILLGQAVWFGRALRHRRGWSYLRGLVGVIPLISIMWKRRRALSFCWKQSAPQLWQAILDSESLASRDFAKGASNSSRFLSWYFRRH
jgi:GT2 family glycosyltransferase